MAQMNKSSRITHLGKQGCGDRRVLLLDLRSALSGISASSGIALHFESASDLEERLTFVGRFFCCLSEDFLRRVLTDYDLEGFT